MKLRLFLLLLMLGTFVFAKNIDVKAGDFAYFGVSIPSANVAGEKGKITVSAFDAYGNRTNYFGEKERTFALKVTGSAAIDRPLLSSADFASGSVSVSVSDRVAESVNLSFFEGGNLLLVQNMATGTFLPGFSLKFNHAPLGSFDISVPEKLIGGEEFNVIVTAKDKAGNIITGYSSIAEGVVVTAEGEKGKKNLLVPAHRFSNGRAEVSLRYDYGGEVRITVTDMNDPQARGNSGVLSFQKQSLARMEVAAPASIRAGVPFAVELKAISQLGIVMKNYSAVGEEILLKTNGRGKLVPDRVPSEAFVQGVARFETLYTVPEPIIITAEPVQTPMAKPERALDASSTPAAVKEAEPLKKPEVVPARAAEKSSVEKTPSQKSSFPLSFHFDSSLGEIERIESEYIPAGPLGVTRIYIRFAKSKKIRNVQPITKEITVNGRVIGVLSVDGTFDKHGRLRVEIKEKEPFAVDVKNGRKSLDLLFLLDN